MPSDAYPPRSSEERRFIELSLREGQRLSRPSLDVPEGVIRRRVVNKHPKRRGAEARARVEAIEASKAPKVDTSTVKVTASDGTVTYVTQAAAKAKHQGVRGVQAAGRPLGVCTSCSEPVGAGDSFVWRTDAAGVLHAQCVHVFYAERKRR